MPQQELTKRPSFWNKVGDSNEVSNGKVAFALSFSFVKETDLRDFANSLPDSVLLCQSALVAGAEHAYGILNQAAEYWTRDQVLARKQSIDILMRLTCQSQISSALAASKLEGAKEVALIGMVESPSIVNSLEQSIMKFGAKRDNSLLELSRAKEIFLKRFHSLPKWVSKNQLVPLLSEKAVLLAFSR